MLQKFTNILKIKTSLQIDVISTNKKLDISYEQERKSQTLRNISKGTSNIASTSSVLRTGLKSSIRSNRPMTGITLRSR